MQITADSFASLQFTIRWESGEAHHTEHILAQKANLWRDQFPPGVKDQLIGARPGQTITLEYAPGDLLPLAESAKTRTVPRNRFRSPKLRGRTIAPRFGRFYPLGLLSGIPGVFRANATPFRVTGIEEAALTADWNHPLAGRNLTLSIEILDAAPKDTDTGGRVTDWTEFLLSDGPGMQARSQGEPTDFTEPDALQRDDPGDDAQFYAEPRLVGHIDRQASACLGEEYARLVKPGHEVLDLMSSVESHLPDTHGCNVTGLGLNAQEMAQNPALNRHVVHDLNTNPTIPFADSSFDLLLCSMSVEYLTRPREVVGEMIRVLRPGGLVAISFSNRWFPPKTTYLWTDLHPFERLGLVADYLLQGPQCTALQTVTYRNWWRPPEDRYSGTLTQADPIFLATARKPG